MLSNKTGLGKASHRKVSVTATAQEVTLGTNQEGMTIQNNGTSIIFIGGSTVASTTYGIQLVPRQIYEFGSVKATFSFYVVCAAGNTSTLGILEYA